MGEFIKSEPSKGEKRFLEGAQEHLEGLEGRASAYAEEASEFKDQAAALSAMAEDAKPELKSVLESEATHASDEAYEADYNHYTSARRAGEQATTVAKMKHELQAIQDYKRQAVDELERAEQLDKSARDAAITWNKASAEGARRDMNDLGNQIYAEQRFAEETDDEVNRALSSGVALLLGEKRRQALKDWQEHGEAAHNFMVAKHEAGHGLDVKLPKQTESTGGQEDDDDSDATRPVMAA